MLKRSVNMKKQVSPALRRAAGRFPKTGRIFPVKKCCTLATNILLEKV
jgi:hypothetical protein